MNDSKDFIDPKKTDSLFQGEDKFAPYPTSVSSPIIKPIDKRLVKATALDTMQQQAMQQIEMLKKQADLIMLQVKQIEERIEVSHRIYKADIGFEPVAGCVYHLYAHQGKEVLSLVAPYEWGKSCPYSEWLASVQLLADKTWQILSQK